MENRPMRQRTRSLPLITCILIAVNVLVYVLLELFGSTENGYYMWLHGALYAPSVLVDGEYYRLFTAAFLHFGASHLMNNMLMLYIMGERLEHAVGSVRMLVIYLLSAVAANVFTVFFYTVTGTDAISAGASGALMGVIGAFLAVLLRRRGTVGGVGRRQVLVLIAVTLYSGFISGTTNNAAHISGLVFGFLLGLVLG